MITSLRESFDVTSINIEDDGSVQVESFSADKNAQVKEAVLKLVEESARGGEKRTGGRGGDDGASGKPVVELGPPPEIGVIYRECPIVSAHPFGVFVQVLPGYEGLVHISELDQKRVRGSPFQLLMRSVCF